MSEQSSYELYEPVPNIETSQSGQSSHHSNDSEDNQSDEVLNRLIEEARVRQQTIDTAPHDETILEELLLHEDFRTRLSTLGATVPGPRTLLKQLSSPNQDQDDSNRQEEKAFEIDLSTPSHPPARRVTMADLRYHAMEQSNRLTSKTPNGKYFPVPARDTLKTRFVDDQAQSTPIPNRPAQVVINGHCHNTTAQPLASLDYQPPRLWDKTKRVDLDPDVKQAFVKAATSYVLSKSNKLSVQSYTINDELKLDHIQAVDSQLKLLRDHISNFDMDDVFTIVVPKSVDVSNELIEPIQTFDLFRDYAKLHISQVANSNAWWNRWVDAPYIRENMSHTHKLFQQNTEDKLWSKSLEEYEKFTPLQQGGPLTLFILLRRIQDSSEASIDAVKTRIKNLKISSLPGEDVDTAVSLIKSSYEALKNASTESHNYVPDDFAETLLEVFQTTTVSEFNLAFKEEATKARNHADKYGGQPTWPSVDEITSLATNKYQ